MTADRLTQYAELQALRAETQALHDETDKLLRAQADQAQQHDMTAIDRALANPVRAVALLHISAKRGVTLEPGVSAELCNMTIAELDAIDRLLDSISERVESSSQDGHAHVRAWAARMEQTMDKLGACVARMQQSFS